MHLDRHRFAEGATRVQDRLVPALRTCPGFFAGYWLTDSASDQVTILLLWRSPEDASRAGDHQPIGAEIADAVGARLIAAIGYDVAHTFDDPAATDSPSAARMTYARGAGVRTGALAVAADEIRPLYRSARGFHSAVWLVDPESAEGVGISLWRSPSDLAADHAHDAPHRRSILHHKKIPPIASFDYDVAVAATEQRIVLSEPATTATSTIHAAERI